MLVQCLARGRVLLLPAAGHADRGAEHANEGVQLDGAQLQLELVQGVAHLRPAGSEWICFGK